MLKITCIFLVVFPFITLAQTQGVGIGTINPRKTLEVGGDMRAADGITIGVIENLEDEDTSTFLIQENNLNIKSLDVSNPTGAALGYIQEYQIFNPDEDWVLDFDTGIDAVNFVLNTLSASFDVELDIPNYSTIPYFSAFIKDGTWHITADFPVADNRVNSELGTWTITCLIYSRDLSKQFGRVIIPMAGGTTGAAANPLID